MTFSISTCYGVVLLLFGFAHLAFGKVVYDSFAFMYGFLFGYCPTLLMFGLSSGVQVFRPPVASFVWSHLAVASAVTLGIAACKWKRVAAGCATGLGGLIVWVLEFTLTSRPMDMHRLLACVALPFLTAFAFPDSCVLLSTVCIGCLFFADGLCILLQEPLHQITIDKAINGPGGAFVSATVHFCVNETLILAVLSALFQFFCLRRPSHHHHHQRRHDDLEASTRRP